MKPNWIYILSNFVLVDCIVFLQQQALC